MVPILALFTAIALVVGGVATIRWAPQIQQWHIRPRKRTLLLDVVFPQLAWWGRPSYLWHLRISGLFMVIMGLLILLAGGGLL